MAGEKRTLTPQQVRRTLIDEFHDAFDMHEADAAIHITDDFEFVAILKGRPLSRLTKSSTTAITLIHTLGKAQVIEYVEENIVNCTQYDIDPTPEAVAALTEANATQERALKRRIADTVFDKPEAEQYLEDIFTPRLDAGEETF